MRVGTTLRSQTTPTPPHGWIVPLALFCLMGLGLPQPACAWQVDGLQSLENQAQDAEEAPFAPFDSEEDAPAAEAEEAVLEELPAAQDSLPDATADEADAVNGEMALAEGLLAFHEGRFGEAIRSLEQADRSQPAVNYYLGLSLLESGLFTEAVQVLDSLRNVPDRPEGLEIDLARALLQSGDAAAAIPLLEGYLQDHPQSSQARGTLAEAYRREGREQEAQEQLSRIPPESRFAAVIDGDYAGGHESGLACGDACQDGLADPQAGRRWNLTFLTAYEYDTNIMLAPEFGGLGSGAIEPDSRVLTALFGDYRFIQDEDLTLGVTGSAYRSWQFEFSQFDLSNFMGGAYVNRSVGCWLWGANYQFLDTLLDGDQFNAEHRLVLSGTYREGDFGHTTGYYEYENVDLQAPALIPAQLRSGDVNSLGFTQAIYLWEGAGRLFGGYRYGVTDTSGSDFDMRRHMVTGRIETPVGGTCGFFGNMVYDAEVRYFWEDYDNPNSLDFFGRPRSDTRLELRTGLQKYLTTHVSLRLDYTFVNNSSNVANLFGVNFYSYDRHLLSSQFIYDF